MRKTYCFFSVLVCMLFGLVNTIQAQQVSLLIGIIDLPAVLQKHPIMADHVPMLQQGFQKEALEFQSFQQQCTKRAEALKQEHKLGTPEFENGMSSIREELRQKERVLVEKQTKLQGELAKLQFKVQQDIKAAVESVAVQKGIITVLVKMRVNRKDVSEEMAAIQEMEGNLVVWNRPECEITNDVINVLAQSVGVPKGNAGALSNISSGGANLQQAPANNGGYGGAGNFGGGMRPAGR